MGDILMAGLMIAARIIAAAQAVSANRYHFGAKIVAALAGRATGRTRAGQREMITPAPSIADRGQDALTMIYAMMIFRHRQSRSLFCATAGRQNTDDFLFPTASDAGNLFTSSALDSPGYYRAWY